MKNLFGQMVKFKKENGQLKKLNENRYEGEASDVVGKAIGYSYGPAFKFEYVLLVPVKSKKIKMKFDDWIFKQDDKIAINIDKMTKFGFTVGELTVMFSKGNPQQMIHKLKNWMIDSANIMFDDSKSDLRSYIKKQFVYRF